MFEAILTLCLPDAPGTCRDLLLPGAEAATAEACEARIVDGTVAAEAHYSAYSQNLAAQCKSLGPVAQFEEIAPGVFVHRGQISDAAAENSGDVANIGFVVGDRSVLVIDTGGSRRIAEMAYRAIRRETDLPISDVVLTHMHPDHVLGASVFAEAGARIVGHAALTRALQDRAETYLQNFGGLIGPEQFIGTRVVLPDMPVEDRVEIDIGGRSLTVAAWPRSHTGTDLTVMDVQTGTLFTGDLVFDEHSPALDGSVLGWQSVLADLTGIEAARAVPGHGGPVLDWPGGAAPLERYLDVLASDTRAAIAEGRSLGEAVTTIAATEAGHWALFELFNPRNATVAFTELEWE